MQTSALAIVVVGPVEAHRMITAMLTAKSVTPAATGGSSAVSRSRKRFTLTVQNQPVSAILSSVCKQLDTELVWQLGEARATELRAKRVSLSVKNATIGQLLEAVLGPLPVTYRLTKSRLIILPK